MNPQFHMNPETYLDEIRANLPRYDELQEAAIDAIPFPPARVLELGIGTGETTRLLLERYPDADQKRDLFRRVREQSRALVLGDQVTAAVHALPPEPGVDFLETAGDLAQWCSGEIVWEADDLAVIRAEY